MGSRSDTAVEVGGLVAIADDPTGREGQKVLIATEDIEVGKTLFQEAPVLFVRSSRDSEEVYEASYAAWKQLDAAAREKALAFHADLEGDDETRRMVRLAGDAGLRGEEAEDFVRLSMVVKHNSAVAQRPTEDLSYHHLGLGLYELGCRANHSCFPNAIWLDAHDGPEGSRLFRSIRPIVKGEEITNDYLSEHMQLDPASDRRRRLELTKSFSCGCERCGAGVDDTRRFPCVTHWGGMLSGGEASRQGGAGGKQPPTDGSGGAECRGVHLARWPLRDAMDALGACSGCGREAGVGYGTVCLELESSVAAEIKAIDSDLDKVSLGKAPPGGLAKVNKRIEDLGTVENFSLLKSSRHHLFAKLSYLRWEILRQDTTTMERLAAKKLHIECLDAVLRVPSLACAFGNEDLAQHLQDAGSPAAALAQQRALRILLIVCGRQHPYTQGASKRLAGMMARHVLQQGFMQCGFCGVFPDFDKREQWQVPCVSLLVCARCKRTRYCSADCQKQGWASHKAQCKMWSKAKP